MKYMSLKNMSEEEKKARKRKQKNEASKRYYRKNKEYYKNYTREWSKRKQEILYKKLETYEKENQRLNNVLNELRENAIAFINIFQDEKTLTLNYNDLKHLRGIINGEEFDVRILKDKLQELKESDK